MVTSYWNIQKYYEKNPMWCLECQKGLESLWYGLRVTNIIERPFQWVKKEKWNFSNFCQQRYGNELYLPSAII